MAKIRHVNAGEQFPIKVKVYRPDTALKYVRDPSKYDHVAIFFRPNYDASSSPFRDAQGNPIWRNNLLDLSRIRVLPARQQVTSDLQELTFQVWIPRRFGMDLLMRYLPSANPGAPVFGGQPAGQDNYPRDNGDAESDTRSNQINLAVFAAYLSKNETLTATGPTGRTWACGQLVVNRRPSIALISPRDGDIISAENHYFRDAYYYFSRHMRVVTFPSEFPLDMVKWLQDNRPIDSEVPSFRVPWGIVHLVGHSDGKTWFTRYSHKIFNTQFLEPWMIRQSTPVCDLTAVDEYSHVAFHLCTFAGTRAQNGTWSRTTNLLESAQTMFGGKRPEDSDTDPLRRPPVHGPIQYVGFGQSPNREVIQDGTAAGNYTAILETNPNPLTSGHFTHVGTPPPDDPPPVP